MLQWKKTVIVVIASLTLAAPTFAASYRSTIRHHHRHGEVFNFTSMRDELVWDGVWLAPAMKVAVEERAAEALHLGIGEALALLPSEWSNGGASFLLSIFVPRDIPAPLVGTKNAWHFELTDANNQHARPLSMEEVAISPLEKKLVPYITPWSRLYFVRFAGDMTPPFALTAFGVNAQSTLVWK